MLGIVILNYNSYKLTIECIKSILECKIEAQIIIVDNNSSDNSYEILKKIFSNVSGVEIKLSNDNGGYSKGNNYGLEFLKDKVEYALILNPDVIIFNKKSIESCIEILKKNELIGCVSPIGLINNQLKMNSISWKLPKVKDEILIMSSIYNKFFSPLTYTNFLVKRLEGILYSEVDVLPGSFLMFKIETLKKINNFDQNIFLYCEEKIIAQKLRKINQNKALIMNEFYFHNHIHKKQDLNSKKFHLKCLMDSKIYYLKNYCGVQNKVLLLVVKILYYINIWGYSIFDRIKNKK